MYSIDFLLSMWYHIIEDYINFDDIKNKQVKVGGNYDKSRDT